MQRYQVADCSVVEHQPQLNTATGGHRADRWVMTADFVWTACQTNGADLQSGSEEPYRSVNDRRLSPAWTEHATGLSTSGKWRVCRWCSRSVEGRRCITRRRWALNADGCTGRLVSTPAQHCCSRAVTRRERRRAYGILTLELTVGYCAVGVKRRSSWQLFSECGIACWSEPYIYIYGSETDTKRKTKADIRQIWLDNEIIPKTCSKP